MVEGEERDGSKGDVKQWRDEDRKVRMRVKDERR